jgi:hypothetical protein
MGEFPGINARFDTYLDLGYTVVVLSNADPPSAARAADMSKEILLSAGGPQ